MGTRSFYLDKPKYFRDTNGKWKLPKESDISPAGREIVEAEPNIDPDTVKQLLATDADKLTEATKEMIRDKTEAEIANQVFFENAGIGLTHLSQCIKENLDQNLGELVARYSIERRIPFVLGAVYVTALANTSALYYFGGASQGYRKIKWSPKDMYVPPKTTDPPGKIKRRVRRKPLDEKPAPPVYKVLDCPICRNKAKICRCGQNYRMFHVCCEDPACACPNYLGMEPMKTEKMAAKAWNTYVKQVKKEEKQKSEAKKGEKQNDPFNI